MPFAIVAIVNATTITGGEDFRGVVNFLFTPLGVMLLVFSIIQFVDVDHRRVWGSVVALFCALEGALVLVFFGTYLYTVSQVVQFLSFFAGSVLGLAGGLWGVFWKRSWQKTAATPGIAGASRWILVGGSIPIFSGKRVLRVVILGTRLAGGRLRQLALQDGLEQAAAGGIDSFFVACCGGALLRNIVPAWLQGLHHLGDHRAGRSTPHDLWCATNDKKETRCDSSKR